MFSKQFDGRLVCVANAMTQLSDDHGNSLLRRQCHAVALSNTPIIWCIARLMWIAQCACVQVACMRHFQTQPLSVLAPVAAADGREGLKTELEKHMPAVRARCQHIRPGPQSRKGCVQCHKLVRTAVYGRVVWGPNVRTQSGRDTARIIASVLWCCLQQQCTQQHAPCDGASCGRYAAGNLAAAVEHVVEAWRCWAVALRWLAEASAAVRHETKQGALAPSSPRNAEDSLTGPYMLNF